MPLTIADFTALAAACAPQVPLETLSPLISVESGFNPLAINVNGKPQLTVRARNRQEAVVAAKRLIAQGRSVDLGLGQINSANLGWLKLSVEAAFEPCANLTAVGTVLSGAYRQARRFEADPAQALFTALSYYNTGHPRRGYANGYVAKVTAAAGLGPSPQAPSAPAAPSPEPAAPPAAWDVFARRAPATLLTRPSPYQALPQPGALQ